MKSFLKVELALPPPPYTWLMTIVLDPTACTVRAGSIARASAKIVESAAPINGMKSDFAADWGVDVDIEFLSLR